MTDNAAYPVRGARDIDHTTSEASTRMSATIPSLHDAVDEILPGLVADRRHLHEHPELGMREYETAKFVAGRLRQLGLEDIRTGIANTGVTALIRGTNPDGPGAGKVVMLRADMDALPIAEENEVEYRSQNPGVMHACGHDAHTTVLLGTARILMERRDQFAGTVKVLFQPCEEQPPGGARFMIEQGALEDPHVDAAFGLHVAPDTEVGLVKVLEGPVSAASDTFFVEIQGSRRPRRLPTPRDRPDHGRRPDYQRPPGAGLPRDRPARTRRHHGRLAPRRRGRQRHPGHGDADRHRPDLQRGDPGAVRPADPRGSSPGSPRRCGRRRPLITSRVTRRWSNDAAMADLVRRAATDVLGAEQVLPGTPMMGVEDMAYYFQRVPGCFWNLGVGERGAGDRHGRP